MTSKKEKEVLLNLFEKYKSMPYLWQKHHPDYTDKDIRDEGFAVLIKIYREFDEKAMPKFLKQKIRNMRNSFAREYRKVLKSQRLGADKAYVPTLYYYEALLFLGELVDTRKPSKDASETEVLSSQYSTDEDSDHHRTYVSSTQKKKKLAQASTWTQENSTNSIDQQQQMRDEKWEAIGRSIGLQLRDLDRAQSTVAHKLINDVMYYAESGILSPYASVSLDPPARQTINIYESPSSDSKEHIVITGHDPEMF